MLLRSLNETRKVDDNDDYFLRRKSRNNCYNKTLIVLVSFFIYGCSHSGSQSDQFCEQKIVTGNGNYFCKNDKRDEINTPKEKALPRNLETECSQGNGDSCNELGASLELKGLTNQARIAYENACNLNIPVACFNAGLIYEKQNKKNFALELFKRSCSGIDRLGCDRLRNGSAEELYLPIPPTGWPICSPAKTSQYDLMPDTLMKASTDCHLSKQNINNDIISLDCTQSILRSIVYYAKTKKACTRFKRAQESYKITHWVISPQEEVCLPAMGPISEESIGRNFSNCQKDYSLGKGALTLRCEGESGRINFIFSKSLSGCKKVLKRIQTLKNNSR